MNILKATTVGGLVLGCVWVAGVAGSMSAEDRLPADDLDPICQAACLLADWVCGTSAFDGIDRLTDGSTEEVSQAIWDDLEPLILDSMAELDAIFDPQQSPSLSPATAGSVASPIQSSTMTTEKMGDELCRMAREAKTEACNVSPANHTYIGERWHQIRWLLDDLHAQADPN